MMNKESRLFKCLLFLFLTTICYSSSHAITTHRKLFEFKSHIDNFGNMLPKFVPLPPSAPSCKTSPGMPISTICPPPRPPPPLTAPASLPPSAPPTRTDDGVARPSELYV